MTKPLRLGVAGLGVVGTGLTQLLQRQGNALAVRGGRPIALAAYSARRSRDGPPETRRRAIHRQRGRVGGRAATSTRSSS